MRSIILTLTLLLSGVSQAQITKNPGDFNKIKAFDRIEVELIPSSENKVEISGHRASEVEVVNNNGELKIRMSLKKLLDGEDILAKVYFKSLNSIDAAEGAFIGCNDAFSQDFISLNAKEGAQIKVVLDVAKAELRSVTGGILKVSGSAKTVDARLGTGGILYAKSLETQQTEIDIKAGGEAEIHATDYVNAKVRGGGHVEVYGNPKQVNKKTALGGSINVR